MFRFPNCGPQPAGYWESVENQSLARTLANIVGAQNVLTDPSDRDYHSRHLSDLPYEVAEGVVLPGSTEELSWVVAAVTAIGCVVIPRGCTPPCAGCVIVDSKRLNPLVKINTEDMYVVVESGFTRKRLVAVLTQKEREEFRKHFSDSLAPKRDGAHFGRIWGHLAGLGASASLESHHRELIDTVRARGRVQVCNAISDDDFPALFERVHCLDPADGCRRRRALAAFLAGLPGPAACALQGHPGRQLRAGSRPGRRCFRARRVLGNMNTHRCATRLSIRRRQ